MKNCPTCHATYPNDFSLCPKDGAPLHSTTELLEGAVLRGKYQILAKLGEGGMGSVYKARHTHFNEIWALKVVSRSLIEEPGFLERFRAESLLMRRLNHPHAVRVHDYDETEDGRPFMVMEYVEGPGLDKLAEGGRLEPERAVRIVMQVCEALGFAHRLGIVHRDIKPSNIVVTTGPDGTDIAKVLDFGIAKVKEHGSMYQNSLTGTGMIVGTPAYMSPEQVMGLRGDKLDGRADLYSLGVVLYELLAGRTPFVSNTPVALLMAHASTPPPDPRTLRDQLPARLVAVVMRALEKDPANRFASAEEMHEALAAAIAPEDVDRTAERPAARPTPHPSPSPLPSASATTSPSTSPSASPSTPSSEAETATKMKTPVPQPNPLRAPEPVASRTPTPASQPETIPPAPAAQPAVVPAKPQPAARIPEAPKVILSGRGAEPTTSRKPMWALVGIAVLVLGAGAWYFSWSKFGGGAQNSAPEIDQLLKQNPPPAPPPAPPPSARTPEGASSSVVGESVDTKPPKGRDNAAQSKEVKAAVTAGDFFYENGEYDNAIKEYEKGLKVDSTNAVLRQKIERAQRAKAAERGVN
ncbi:MAG TPA: protein kinase [Candidatus Acidoferrales bacterium]|nr:protein kinase [Candidatus Acidoferrales bacterium]